MRSLALPILLVALTVSGPSAAAPQTKLLAPADLGCAAWKQSKGDDERRAPLLQWVRGFLSGHNYALPATQMAVVSEATVESFVDRYCAEHGAATIAEAAMRMSDRYSGRNEPVR